MYFEESGDLNARTIVFIHGGGVSGWMWRKQLEYFKDYHCIVPDLPEHGKSLNEGPLSLKDCAVKIANLIEDKANGGKAIVVGHSLGAKTVVELLSVHPGLLDRAVVASALFVRAPWLQATHKHYIYKITVRMLKSKSFLNYMVRNFKFPDSIYEENCRSDFRKLTWENLYREYEQLYQNIDLPDGLGRANVPTLILAGEREIKAMKRSVSDIAGALPSATGAYLPKADHTYPWSMHESFNEVVRLWIEDRVVRIEG